MIELLVNESIEKIVIKTVTFLKTFFFPTFLLQAVSHRKSKPVFQQFSEKFYKSKYGHEVKILNTEATTLSCYGK